MKDKIDVTIRGGYLRISWKDLLNLIYGKVRNKRVDAKITFDLHQEDFKNIQDEFNDIVIKPEDWNLKPNDLP